MLCYHSIHRFPCVLLVLNDLVQSLLFFWRLNGGLGGEERFSDNAFFELGATYIAEKLEGRIVNCLDFC